MAETTSGLVECPACENDGGACAVCKPESGQWITNEEYESVCRGLRNMEENVRHYRDEAEKFAARLATAEAERAREAMLRDVYRRMLAVKLGYHLIPENTVVRPDAASYVKPSEFDDLLAHRIEEAMSRAPSTGGTP